MLEEECRGCIRRRALVVDGVRVKYIRSGASGGRVERRAFWLLHACSGLHRPSSVIVRGQRR
jgi:hypothetical protein